MSTNNRLDLYYTYEAYIYTIIKAYHLPPTVDVEDLTQEARRELLTAIDYFIINHEGRSPSTYLYQRLRRHINQYVSLQKHTFSVSTYLLEEASRLEYHIRRNPKKELKDILEIAGISEKTYENIKKYQSISITSKDSLRDSEGIPTEMSLLSHYSTPEQEVLHEEKINFLEKSIGKLKENLPSTQLEVLNHMLSGKTYEEIGNLRGVSRQAVGLVMKKCKDKLERIIRSNPEYKLVLNLK